MREIKFRLVFKNCDSDRIKFVYCSLDNLISYSFNMAQYIKNSLGCGGVGYLPYRLIDKNEFSGLHDRNGKEIYEGDIVQEKFIEENQKYMTYQGIVEWFDSGWFLKTKKYGMIALTDCSVGLNIIGNIYENKKQK